MVVALHLPFSRDEAPLDPLRPLFGDGYLVGMYIFDAEPDSQYFRHSSAALGFSQKLLQLGAVLFHHHCLFVSLCVLDSFPNQGLSISAIFNN